MKLLETSREISEIIPFSFGEWGWALSELVGSSMASVTKHIIPQILLFVVCVVIFNHTAKIEQQKQQRPPETEETLVTAAKSATMTTTSDLDTVPEGAGGDVKEIFGVRIERNPSQFKLDELSVTSWPTYVSLFIPFNPPRYITADTVTQLLD